MEQPAAAERGWFEPPAEALVGEVVEEPPPRPGPKVLAQDSWDDHTAITPLPLTEPPARRSGRPTRVWVVVGAVLVALAAAIALPFALRADPATEVGAAPSTGLPTALDQPAGTPSGTPAVPTPIATAAAAAPSPSATATSGAAEPTGGQPTGTTGTNSNPPPPAEPGFTPVTFEAENGTRTGSATIWDGYPNASGGRLVRNIGNWGGTPGTLRINNVNIPTTGEYTITIYFVHPDGETNRSATMTVSGNAAVTVNFIGNATCCLTKVVSNVTIAAGTHTITFANPTGHAPSIDRIVVSRP